MTLLQKARAAFARAFSSTGPTVQRRVITGVNTATGMQSAPIAIEPGNIGERLALPAERISNKQILRAAR